MGNYTTDNNGKQDLPCLPLGINEGIDASQYHKTLGLTKGGLMELYKSPAHFWQWMTSPPTPSTQAMMLGTATHTLVFEPEKYESEICVIPIDAPKKPTAKQVNAKKRSKSTIENIQWWNDFYEKNKNKTLITEEQNARAWGMAKSVISNEDIFPMINHDSAKPEVTIVANELVDGLSISCKIRCYMLTMNNKIMLDLKTTEDSSREKFTKSFMSLGYWMQAAHYLQTARLAGINVEKFIFVAVEKNPPFSVALYELDDNSLKKAFEIRGKLLKTLAKCISTGKYPSHSKGINYLTMPYWLS